MKRWHKRPAKTAQQTQRGISIASGAQVPKASGRPVQSLLPVSARAFLAALERAHANVSAWLPTLDDGQASPADQTRASLAIMVEANSLTQEIYALAEATRADAVAVGKARTAHALANIRRVVRQHV